VGPPDRQSRHHCPGCCGGIFRGDGKAMSLFEFLAIIYYNLSLKNLSRETTSLPEARALKARKGADVSSLDDYLIIVYAHLQFLICISLICRRSKSAFWKRITNHLSEGVCLLTGKSSSLQNHKEQSVDCKFGPTRRCRLQQRPLNRRSYWESLGPH
jgi:hypothetical protein